jgi:Zn-dependent protease
VSRDNSSAATTLSVLAVVAALVAFCLFFTVFLLIPFFIFIGGGVALVISERTAKAKKAQAPLPALPAQRPPRALPEKTGGER